MPGLSLPDPCRNTASGVNTVRLRLRPATYADWAEAKAKRRRPEGYVDYPVPERDATDDRRWWSQGAEAGHCWMWGIWLKPTPAPAEPAQGGPPEAPLIGLLSAFGFGASGECEIGIELLNPRWMRRGYGREALVAWTEYLRAQGRERMQAWVHPGNLPSLGLFAASGFRDVGRVRDVEQPDWTFRVFKMGPRAWLEAPLDNPA